MGCDKSVGSYAIDLGKAAEDSRTPKRWRATQSAAVSARFWSAAVLCRLRAKVSNMTGRLNRTPDSLAKMRVASEFWRIKEYCEIEQVSR
jgi:hypothetical protein